ncbi:MAG: hypothetical protein ACLQBL_05320 [Polyangiaceae bacterium]
MRLSTQTRRFALSQATGSSSSARNGNTHRIAQEALLAQLAADERESAADMEAIR